jgi:hypothetical protein
MDFEADSILRTKVWQLKQSRKGAFGLASVNDFDACFSRKHNQVLKQLND